MVYVVAENCAKNSSFVKRMTSLNMNRKYTNCAVLGLIQCCNHYILCQ